MNIPGEFLLLYISNIIKRYERMSGPKINPKIPNTNNPPTIPISIIEECTLVLFATKVGFTVFSKKAEIRPNKITPSAGIAIPPTKRKIVTGTQIMAVPIIGKIPARHAASVKNKALSTPKIKNPIPTKTPCKIPIITCP